MAIFSFTFSSSWHMTLSSTKMRLTMSSCEVCNVYMNLDLVYESSSKVLDLKN
jgi:hypothetical protein